MRRSFFALVLAVALTACGVRQAEGVVTEGPGFSYLVTHTLPPFELQLPDSLGIPDVSPHVLGLEARHKDGVYSVTVPKTGYYVLTYENGRKFFVFAQEKKETPSGVNVLDCEGVRQDVNSTGAIQKAIDSNAGGWLVFPKGVYLVSGLDIPSSSRIFLEEGAVIKADRDSIRYDAEGTHGFIEINGAHDVTICGDGVIDGDGAAIKPVARNRRNIFAARCTGLHIDGIISFNPASWNTHIIWCDSVEVRGVKLLNDWNVKNTDGFDPDCCTEVLIENCFGHCSDDFVAVKSTDRLGEPRDVRGIVVRGCVMETRKSALKVGTETCAASMTDILFENNIAVEADRGMSLYVKDGTELSHVTYRNNRFERNHPDLCRYPYHFYVLKRTPDSKVGSIHDVLIENCVFERAFPYGPKIEDPFGVIRDNVISCEIPSPIQ